MGGHREGVGEQLAFLVQQPGVRADLASWAAFHRHSVVSPIPKPAATVAAEAIPVATSCTAASRRLTSFSVANAKLACPNTNTAPPCAPSTGPSVRKVLADSAHLEIVPRGRFFPEGTIKQIRYERGVSRRP